MSFIFNGIDKFFASLNTYIGLGESFVIFVGLFLLVVLFSFIATSRSYESKLIKAIDMLNGYFVNNPKITEDNLVLFNQIMRHNKVPKLLRKHWQQFMLYREHNASYYMSFENCVVIPLRNSKFKRDKVIMNLFAYILAGAALIVNTYLTAETSDVAFALQRIFLAPIIILLINYIASIVLDLKESAIINDLNQNYQYFETNIDKATKTLPDYVDYEILFEKQEIKKGIPVLYQYLQKRAEEEQRELELARLKNVEHEKFNFDEAGLAGSLVLERAMQEAENYIAERKKYSQDIEQINSEITQEDMRYREITKEYNRQMQVSKETFANFKKELEEATSTIQANYLKKQQQQELDRQRNLERDFDTETDRHKKVIESYQAELDSIDGFIAESRKNLQDAMMAEFDTYSSKVYDEAKKVVEEREKEKHAKIKQKIVALEEQLYAKNKGTDSNAVQEYTPAEPVEQVKEEVKEDNAPVFNYQESAESEEIKPAEIENQDEANESEADTKFSWNFNEEEKDEDKDEGDEDSSWTFKPEEEPENKEENNAFESLDKKDEESTDSTEGGYQSYSDFLKEQNIEPFNFNPNAEPEETNTSKDESDNEDWFSNNTESTVQEDESTQKGENVEEESLDEDDDFAWFDEILNDADEEADSDLKENEEDNEEVDDNFNNEAELEDESDEEDDDSEGILEIKPEPVAKKKAGRPRKAVSEVDNKPKRKPGRPKKVVNDEQSNVVAKKRGRPRKVESDKEVSEPKRRVGRPKKAATKQEPTTVKAGRGRPKKVVSAGETVENKKGPGRPRKKKAGRPRKVENVEAVESNKPKKPVGRPKKSATNKASTKVKAGRGRPRKVDLNKVDGDVDLEAYLKVIDNAIAKENAKIKKTQKALEDNASLKKKKK